MSESESLSASESKGTERRRFRGGPVVARPRELEEPLWAGKLFPE